MRQFTTQEELTALLPKEGYEGNLSNFVVNSIREGKRNYPVTNLLAYLQGAGLKLRMVDEATEDGYFPRDTAEVHKVLRHLMRRWEMDFHTLQKKAGVYYTSPAMDSEDKNAPLSIKVLLAVCGAIRCKLELVPADEKQ